MPSARRRRRAGPPGDLRARNEARAGLLKEFQRKQVQFAIVVDEYGGTAGPRHHRGSARGDRRRDPRRVRRRDRARRRRGQRLVRVQRQGQHRRDPRAAGRRDRAGRVRDRRRLRADPRRAVPAVGETFELDGCRGSPRRRAPPHSQVRFRRVARPAAEEAACTRSPAVPRLAGSAATCSARHAARRRARAVTFKCHAPRRLRLARRPAQRRQVHAAQRHRRRQGRHRLRQAADDAERGSSASRTTPTGRSCSSTRRASTGRCTA